jgi:hypothetical protein
MRLFLFVFKIWLITMQLLVAIKNCGSVDDLADNLMIIFCTIQSATKILTIGINIKEFQTILISIIDHWTLIKDKNSAAIVRSYIKIAKLMTYLEFFSTYTGICIIVLRPYKGLVEVFTNQVDNKIYWLENF